MTIEIEKQKGTRIYRDRLIGDEASAWMRPSFDQGQLCHSFVILPYLYPCLSLPLCNIYLSLSLYFYSHLLFASFYVHTSHTFFHHSSSVLSCHTLLFILIIFLSFILLPSLYIML